MIITLQMYIIYRTNQNMNEDILSKIVLESLCHAVTKTTYLSCRMAGVLCR